MNTNTGTTYVLGPDFAEELRAVQTGFAPSAVPLSVLARSADERAAVEAVRRGDSVVPVSGEVAQMVQLGRRELDRRKRRRKQARESRKRNR